MTTPSLPARKKWLRRLAGALVFSAVGFTAASAFFAYKFTGPVPRTMTWSAGELPAETETVRFNASDGVPLAGWFVPRAGATRAVVLLHGHQGSRRQMLARARFFHAQGYAVLLYDARGHGESGGDRVSIGWFEGNDLVGAIAFVRERGARDVGVIGMSQGAATIALAAERLRDVKWAVLESSYPSLRDAVDRRFRRTFLVPGALGGLLMVPFAEWRLGISVDQIAPIDHVGRLPCPVLILHGRDDTHTLADAAEAMFARVSTPKALWIVPGAAHVDFYGFAKDEYERRVLAFVDGAK